TGSSEAGDPTRILRPGGRPGSGVVRPALRGETSPAEVFCFINTACAGCGRPREITSVNCGKLNRISTAEKLVLTNPSPAGTSSWDAIGCRSLWDLRPVWDLRPIRQIPYTSRESLHPGGSGYVWQWARRDE